MSQDEMELRDNMNEFTFQPQRIATPLKSDQGFGGYAIKKKPTFKQALDQGRRRIDPNKFAILSQTAPVQVNEETESIRTDSDIEYDDEDQEDNQTFQISVNIGGAQKQIQARVDAKPKEIAQRFIKEHDVDQKYLQTLTQLIKDQISKIKSNSVK